MFNQKRKPFVRQARESLFSVRSVWGGVDLHRPKAPSFSFLWWFIQKLDKRTVLSQSCYAAISPIHFVHSRFTSMSSKHFELQLPQDDVVRNSVVFHVALSDIVPPSPSSRCPGSAWPCNVSFPRILERTEGTQGTSPPTRSC